MPIPGLSTRSRPGFDSRRVQKFSPRSSSGGAAQASFLTLPRTLIRQQTTPHVEGRSVGFGYVCVCESVFEKVSRLL